MSIQRFDTAGRRAYLADTARVAGQITLGDGVNVWYGAAIRGDVAPITIGDSSNVQDNATVHCDSGEPNVIGAGVVIGHNAVVHGRSVGDGTLIGMHATVLGRTVIGQRCLVAAGAVVPPELEVPDDHVVMGVPGRVVRKTNDEEKAYLSWLAGHYVQLAQRYHEHPNTPEQRPYGHGTKLITAPTAKCLPSER
ncbi:MAG: gamma carbonic anhydrase family protein [Planctomycetota bacterium]